RHRRGPEQDDPGDPESSHCPSTFAAFAASAAFFFSFFFLRRVTPYVPRKILPRLLRMSFTHEMFSVRCRGELLRAAELQNALELVRRYRHHRETPHAHQRKVGERPVLLNLGERDRLRQSLYAPKVDHRQLGILLLRLGIAN